MSLDHIDQGAILALLLILVGNFVPRYMTFLNSRIKKGLVTFTLYAIGHYLACRILVTVLLPKEITLW